MLTGRSVLNARCETITKSASSSLPAPAAAHMRQNGKDKENDGGSREHSAGHAGTAKGLTSQAVNPKPRNAETTLHYP